MQTLFIPEKIEIQLVDALDKPICQDKILVGIRTFANHKNSIDLSPFLSDENGIIKITADNIKERCEISVSYGLMDYSELESAKPFIEIYYWGNTSLNRYIDYWAKILEEKKDPKRFEKTWGEKLANAWKDKLTELESEFVAIEKRERQELKIFESCYNRKASQIEDVVLIEDKWDKPNKELNYHAAITFNLK